MSSEDGKNKKPIEVVFAPGCFDNFDGTQEELEELIQQIKDMAISGKLLEKGTPVSIDELDIPEYDLSEYVHDNMSEILDSMLSGKDRKLQ
jgi:hypothetical protein